jgi:hypothetical protein
MSDPPSSITLVLLAQSGDRGALNQLFGDLQDGLYVKLAILALAGVKQG